MDVWVFDNDGTLYNDRGTERLFMQKLLQSLKRYVGRDIGDLKKYITELKDKWKTEFSIIAISNEFGIEISRLVEELYLQLDLESCEIELTDSVIPAILAGLPGKKVVLTNNPSDFAKNILSHLGIRDFFDDILGMVEVNFILKPKREAFMTVQAVYPDCTFHFVDDKEENAVGAMRCGWRGILFNPLATETPMVNDKGMITISSYSQLAEI